jgi:titin
MYLQILSQRIFEFVRNTEISAGKHLPKIQKELTGLKDKLNTLKHLTDVTRQKINASIEYFELLEEAKEWFKEGSKLLIVVARKATSIKIPEDATILLKDIETFLKPGEEIQEKRIQRIKELSTRIFGKLKKKVIFNILVRFKYYSVLKTLIMITNLENKFYILYLKNIE